MAKKRTWSVLITFSFAVDLEGMITYTFGVETRQIIGNMYV